MGERELRPNYSDEGTGANPINAKMTLPLVLREKIEEVLCDFNFSVGQRTNISRHILITDVDVALEDSVPIFVWIKLHANKAREREEYWIEELKRLEMQSLSKSSKEKITVQKASVQSDERYPKIQKLIREYRLLRRNCEDVAQAMILRKEIAQTKSADLRKEFGGYGVR